MHRFAVVVLMCSCLQSVDSLVDPRIPDIFYPFGVDQGDQVATTSDDLSVDVSVGGNVPFCTLTYNTIYLNTNGFISFGKDYKEYSAVAFPIPTCSMLAVYWADADTRINNGRVYYRTVNAATNPLLTQASRAIRTAFTSQGFFDFQARWLFIATWHNVTYYGGNATTSTNSFQVVIATDWFNSFAMLNYGNMTWTCGTRSYVPAEVGYNCPDGRTYDAFPTSRTDAVIRIGSETNVGEKGRLMYRLDSSDGSGCVQPPISDSVPSHSCPTLSGPTVINRLWFEFYCTVNTTVTDSRARFNVTFYSDTDVIYNATATPTDKTVTLDERYLLGRLGKRLYCTAVSYWSNNPTERSAVVRSSRFHVPGIEAIMSPVRATETDPKPVQLDIKSTLPITCQEQDSSGHPINCQLVFDVFVSSNDIAARQRIPGEVKHCMFTYSEADWKPSENRAYNVSARLEIRAKIDLFLTSPRYSEIHFRAKLMTMRKVNGTSYSNIWTGYSVRVAQVYHVDSPSALVNCSAGGDPEVTTFDGLSYVALPLGEFIYARSVYELSYEIQVRHGPCPPDWSGGTSCICGVAMREEDMILAADRCNKEDIVHQISYGMKEDMRGAGITISADGHSMKMLMPSGGKIIVHIWYLHMNIEIYVPEKIRTNGLCGTHDGNRTNDLNYQGSGMVASVLSNGQAPADVIESWRVYPNASLFAGQRIALPRGDAEQETPLSFCTCALDQEPECSGLALADNTSSMWEPNFPVTAKEPESTDQHVNRKRKAAVERSDNKDYYYDPAAFYGFLTDRTTSAQWPTVSGVTESQARDMCTSRIVTIRNTGPSCYSTLNSSDVAARVIQKCVSDFMLMDNLTLAADDKVPELQHACINDFVARNRSDISNTSEVMAQVISILPTVTAYKCEPYDCSGHGNCSNGRCVCDAEFIGTDCAVHRAAVPSIIRLLDPPVCDINTRLCRSVSLVTANRTSSVRCRIVVGKMNGESTTYNTSGQVTSLNAMSCSLPPEPLELYNNNFTALHGPGFDFGRLPHGGAVLTYTVTISNDGVRYSDGQMMKVVDTLCMKCSPDCTHKTDACLINGYCFAHLAINPYDSTLYCLTDVSTTSWSTMNRTQSKSVETKYEDSDSNDVPCQPKRLPWNRTQSDNHPLTGRLSLQVVADIHCQPNRLLWNRTRAKNHLPTSRLCLPVTPDDQMPQPIVNHRRQLTSTRIASN